jgi:hypothetical protein
VCRARYVLNTFGKATTAKKGVCEREVKGRLFAKRQKLQNQNLYQNASNFSQIAPESSPAAAAGLRPTQNEADSYIIGKLGTGTPAFSDSVVNFLQPS